MDHCLLCNSVNTNIVFTEFGINVLRCASCGHVYSSYDLKNDYSGYFKDDIEKADHFWWREAHARMYEDFCGKFMKDSAGRLLDFGCGLGYFIKQASGRAGWEIYGAEISEPAVRFARNKLGLKDIFLGKTEDSCYSENFFDIITLWDVIEHIPDPTSLLKYLRVILKDNGILFLHTPNINIQLPKAKIKKLILGEKNSVHFLEARDHINIYSPKTITRLLESNGFLNVEFTHLYPIQSIAGSAGFLPRIVKNSWYCLARILARFSRGKINIDNLFVIAKK